MSREVVPSLIGPEVVSQLAYDIAEAAPYLSELDGATGDGDHGINMTKGFSLAASRVDASSNLSACLDVLSGTLIDDVGGAMGPLYGVFFEALAAEASGHEWIDAATFAAMLESAVRAVLEIGGATLGDKTLADVLIPSLDDVSTRLAAGDPFDEILVSMSATAEQSRDATKDLVARLGRASRVAERSRGHIDAGAASCAVILQSLAATLRRRLTIQPQI